MNLLPKTKIGFTGTQTGLSEEQFKMLSAILYLNVGSELHHGVCQGADAEAHELATDLGLEIVQHPPKNQRKMAKVVGGAVRSADEYIIRNHNLVDETNRLIACPQTEVEELRSGTWATIRYATKMKKPVTIIFPNGTLGIK